MFTHLHTHTEYSLLDGCNKIKEYVARVKELGMDSAAITDHGVMYGVIDFYKEAKKQGIKPILGCEVYVAPNSRFEKDSNQKYYHLILLAENETGYQNLVKLVSKGFTEGYYYKPRVDMELLNEYHEGLIASSACLAGEIARLIMENRYDDAKEAAIRYNECFGEGNFFLELQDHGDPNQADVNKALLKMHDETGIPLIATNDIHYTNEDDVEPHDVLLCLQTGKTIYDENRMRYEGGQYYIKSEDEMRKLFAYAPEAIENTNKIAERCNVEIEFGVTKLPKFEVPEGYTSYEYLKKLCDDGIKERYGKATPEIKERLDYELSTIEKMGYVDYFLIVWDFVNFSREHGIMVGPGRGSAAGSIVSYALGITKLDPLKYSLIFERFLNPDRVSMPDIDIDFCYERRPEVIEYVAEKYGEDQVAQIVTFGTLAARNVIRDVGRVLDLPYALCDKTAKMIPQELNITINKALEMNPELFKEYTDNQEVKRLIDLARRLEGLPRHTSMHAAGVVIGQRPIDDFVPLAKGSDGSVVTQFTMTALEELGLLKMDFLGLRTLTVIRDAINNVKANKNIDINIDDIPLDDKAVYDYISTGKCEGIFQLESAGMRSFMKDLKPACLEDLIAGISLYRPGPMDFIPLYIKGKNDPEHIKYDCPQIEPILESTYGCIVYQEQVMQIVRDLAGYTMGRSDLVRRAMSKKKTDVMEVERQNFVYGNVEEGVKGCIANGISEEVALRIYDEMIEFAKYAFNKSHAAAYAVVSYQTAWLKCHYPVEFMAALLTSVIDKQDKVSAYIQVCRQMGIKILPPDVNESEKTFSVHGDAIRYALVAVKAVGGSVVDAIIKERQNGKFISFDDFIERVPEVNKRAAENLIKAGAFDTLGGNRRQYMMVYQSVMSQANKDRKNTMDGQMSLFDFAEDKSQFETKLPDVPEFTKEELLSMEKDVLGVYLSGHPLEEHEECWRTNITNTSQDFVMDEDIEVTDGANTIVGGIVAEKMVKFTKQNKPMAFLTLEDLYGTVEVIVFPNQYERYGHSFDEGDKIFVQGNVQVEENKNGKVIAEQIHQFSEGGKGIKIYFNSLDEYRSKAAALNEMMESSPGDVKLMAICDNQYKVLDGGLSEDKISEIEQMFDKVSVVERKIDMSRPWIR